MDAAVGGAFLSLTISQAIALVEKMASNQGWNEERTQIHKRGGGMHQLKEVDMFMKKLDNRAGDKKEVMHIYDSHMTCEECGDTGHPGNHCPEMLEDANYINNNNNNYYNVLNKIKVGINRCLTTQVIIKVTILITIIIIFHL